MRRITVTVALLAVLFCAVSVYSSAETAVPVDGSIGGTGVGDIPVKGETFSFQAEVSRLMDIIINSLYSNKDIFLRELISNASDALDKLRFLALTNKDMLGEGEDAKLGITIAANKEQRTLTILDRGIGMSKDELVSNLGTIARSGTTKFLEAMQAGQDSLSLIGQFGVGFYSAYLVADKVVVASKKYDDKQFIWESDAQETFKVYEDPRGNTVGLHGTEITLFLKEDADEYLDQENLEKIIARYSEFINFPILLRKEKVVKEEVPVEDDEDTVADLDSEETEVVEEDGSAAPKTKTVSRTVVEFKQINEYIPIWTRPKDSISEQEYQSFFKLLTKETTDPLTWTHFKAEGGVDFTALLYIPSSSPSELYEKYYQKSASLRLYVRKVLIADQFEELMPRYMNFVRGVVDSDDLPINVSRETLQKDKILQVIGKRLVRNVLKTLESMAKKEEVSKKEESDAEVEEDDDSSKDGNDKATYEQFWKEFGRSIKLGVLEDTKNKNKLLNLLRFPSSKSGEGLTSLQGYVSRMKENQADIYYIGGENIETVSNSPMLEKLKKLDYEVLYFVDPLDEYLTQGFSGFDGYPLASVSQEGLKLGDEEEEDLKSLEEEFKPLCDWLEEVLGPRVEKVIVSSRVSQAPAVVVTSQYGFSANMERILKAQPIGDKDRVKFMTTRKTFEINPKNPVIKKMKEVVAVNPRDPKVYDSAFLIFDSALISSGFAHEDPVNLVARIQRSVNSQLGLDVAFPAVPADLGKEDVEVDEEIDLSAKDEKVHDEL